MEMFRYATSALSRKAARRPVRDIGPALAAVLAALALGAVGLPAQTFVQTADRLEETDAFTVQTDNDIFVNSDRDYSAGLELTWTSAAQENWEIPDGLRPWQFGALGLRLFGRQRYDLLGSRVSIGTKMFTPADLRATELLEDQRPYGGWTYLRFAFDGRAGNTINTFALTAGIVGPASQADDLQEGIHEVLGNLEPQGWDNQLDNEFGLVLEFEQTQRLFYADSLASLEVELTNVRNLALGNVDASATTGLRLRAGRNIRSDFKVAPAAQAMTDAGFASADANGAEGLPSADRRSKLYFDFGALGSFVARNLFLDGNTFEDSHSVDKRNWIGEINAGIGYENEKVRVGLHYIYTSKEFDLQDGGHGYNALSVTFR